ncbi:MAG: threonine-phosphate decarboxylase CobD [bacterium]
MWRWIEGLRGTHGGNIYEVGRRYCIDPDEIIDFSASINPLGLSPRAEAALSRSLHRILHYPDPDSRELSDALAQYHGIDRKEVLVGNGSTEFIYLIPRVFRPKRALIVAPAFSEYERALSEVGCSVEYFPASREDGFVPNVDGLLSALGRGYSIIYICNPANPTGALIPRKDMLEIEGECERRGTICVIDEAFIDFCEEDESLKREAAGGRSTFVLRSMTKFFALPGLRVGYVIGNRDGILEMASRREPWTVNALAQVAALESLRDEEYIRRTRELVASERDYLRRGIEEIGCFHPFESKANFLLVEILCRGLDSTALRQILIPHRILIRDCESFHNLGQKFFRIAVRSREENDKFLSALRKLKNNRSHGVRTTG